MRNYTLMFVIGIFGWLWHTNQLPFMQEAGAFDESGQPQVWLFTVKNCGQHCNKARNELKRRRVPFKLMQVNIDNDNNANTKLWQTVRTDNTFPLVVAGNDNVRGASSPQIAGVLGLNFGKKYLSRTEKHYFKKHFYADGSPKIVMYGADWCGYCKKLRNEFGKNDVDFIEIDVDKSSDKATIVKTLEVYGYPATWVGYTRVNGSTYRAVKAVLKSY